MHWLSGYSTFLLLASFQIGVPIELLRINQEGVLKQSGFFSFFHPIELKFIQFTVEGLNLKITKGFFPMTKLRSCFLFPREMTLSTECTVLHCSNIHNIFSQVIWL